MQYPDNRPMPWRLCTRAVILLGALLGCGVCRADVLSAVQLLREGGCGGLLPAAQPLHRSALLDHAARDWATHERAAQGGASGTAGGVASDALSPGAAASRSGYNPRVTAGVHISGPDSSAIQLLRRTSCRTISDQGFQDIGVYTQGSDTWLLLAAAYPAPSRTEAPLWSARVLDLVNAVRASGTHCGGRAFAPAPPVKLSTTLAGVALGHANDMAEHDYFEHEDRAGHTPADRVRAVGYREKLVGENIAYGPQSADEVVRGWLDSPGHCENIMDARFAEMGVAFAAGQASKHGLYWVQLLAAPQV
jgi:uncharacterized protein YkwD